MEHKGEREQGSGDDSEHGDLLSRAGDIRYMRGRFHPAAASGASSPVGVYEMPLFGYVRTKSGCPHVESAQPVAVGRAHRVLWRGRGSVVSIRIPIAVRRVPVGPPTMCIGRPSGSPASPGPRSSTRLPWCACQVWRGSPSRLRHSVNGADPATVITATSWAYRRWSRCGVMPTDPGW